MSPLQSETHKSLEQQLNDARVFVDNHLGLDASLGADVGVGHTLAHVIEKTPEGPVKDALRLGFATTELQRLVNGHWVFMARVQEARFLGGKDETDRLEAEQLALVAQLETSTRPWKEAMYTFAEAFGQ